MIHMEDKQAICNALAEALRLTRLYRDLAYLEYDDHTETVTARFENGRLTVINVDADSGYTVISDVVNSLGVYRFGM